MDRSFLEEFGIEESIIEKIMDANKRDIEEANKSSEGLLQQISDLKNDIVNKEAEYKTSTENIIRDNAVNMALLKANAKTEKAVKALINIEDISIDENGNVSGLEEQIEKLVNSEDTKYLFDNRQFRGTVIGDSPKEPGVDFENMNYTQMCAYLENN